MSHSPELLSAAPGLFNAFTPLPNVLTAGQPSPQELRALAAAGVKVVLDTRAPNEPRGFDEAAETEAAGLAYVNVPVAGWVQDEAFAEVRRIVAAADEQPVLFHCASANRVGGLLIPVLMLDRGMDRDAALQTAQRVGLRDGMLAQLALDYVRRQQG
jgi:uncharacterized protein (TIGR01244 family)